ncbi:MAG: ZIP family metal transporter [Anaerolineae bacterium]
MDHLWNATLYGGFAGLTTLIGIYLVLMKETWVRQGSIYLVSFASGTLLSAALLDILPESLELNSSASLYVLLSFVAFYILEQNLVLHASHEDLEDCEDEERHRLHSLGVISFLGIGFHSLLDGVIIGAGFLESTTIGLIATIGVISHELPEGLSIMGLLFHAGFSRNRGLVYSIIVALATPVGAVASSLLFQGIKPHLLGALLGVAAGSFLYIAASDLIPQTREHDSPYIIPLVVGGMLTLFALGLVLK